MLLMFDYYYRRFGVRKLPQMISPPTFSVDYLQLSRSAVYHCYSHDPEITMPDPQDMVFRPYNKKIMVNHISDLAVLEGNPKRISKPVKMMYRDWQLKNNARFRWSPEPERMATDSLSLAVYNYGLLHQTYRYVDLPMTPYYQWSNIEKTMLLNIGRVASETHRHQFIVRDIPVDLYSVGILNMLSKQVNLRMLRMFSTPEALFLLDMWRWIDPETRELSVMSVLPREALRYVNIILRYKDRFTVINLQSLDDWNAGIEPLNPDSQAPRIKPMQLQRFMLKLLMAVQTSVIMPEPSDEDDRATDDQTTDDQVTDDLDDELIDRDDAIDDQSTKPPLADIVTPAPLESPHDADAAKVSLTPTRLPTPPVIDDIDLKIGTVDIETMTQQVDEELAILDKLTKTRRLDLDDEVLEDITEHDLVISDDERQAMWTDIQTPQDPIVRLKLELDQQAEAGVITAQNYRNLIKYIDQSQELRSPTEPTKKLSEFVRVTPADIEITPEDIKVAEDIKNISDKTMLKSTLQAFDRKYIENVLPKDIQANIHSLANAGIIVRDYQIETVSSALGQYEHHTVKVRPIDGVESTLHFRIPRVNKEGEMMAGGVKIRQRKQRADLPIRKINPTTVALTSYYGKSFIQRSPRKQFDDMEWLCNQLIQIGFSGGNEHIRKVVPANVFDNKFKAPRIYSGLARRFKTLQLKSATLMLDHTARSQLYPSLDLKKLEQSDRVLCGQYGDSPLLVDQSGQFHVYRQGSYSPVGDIYDLTAISNEGSPISFSELKVFSKTIALGVVLGYYIGLTNLLKLLGCRVQVFDRKTKIEPRSTQYKLTFKNKILILEKADAEATLLLSGFLFYKDTIKYHDLQAFDDQDVYLLLLDQRGLSAKYLRELDNLNDMFVDPITKSILEEMKEPTTFQGLLFRSNELLTTDYHPDSNDMRCMRIKGYERIAGLMYREMVAAVRDYRSRNIRGRSQLNIAPYAVWRSIGQDQTVKLCEDINPISELKEIEAVTYVGIDGRSKDAMTKESREFHPTDMGVMSEATVDSGDVGINTYLSGNPRFKSVRGVIDTFDLKEDGVTSLLSTSALVSPFSTHDDPKRTNFVSIQAGHTVACDGYHQPTIRTGYESIIPYKVGQLYACMAEQDGRVVEITDHLVTVEYRDQSRVSVPIGRQYGRAEGSLYPHDIVTMLKPNQSFKKGDAIAYNTAFFEPDWMNPRRIVYKSSLMSTVAFMETTQTLEDANSISLKLSQQLTSRIVKERMFVVQFNQNIRNVTKPGTALSPKDVIFIIEDPITSGIDVFDADTIESLSKLSNLAPKAKVTGVLDRYEVYYNGDVEDMSPTLKKLALQSNRLLSDRTKGTEHHITNGRVNEEYRVEGNPLQVDTMVIKAYIIVSDRSMLGDKVVFGNQLKSIVSEVMLYDMKTEAGEDIDAIFSYASVGKRITLSPLLMGTCASLLEVLGRKAVEVYRQG